VKRFFLTCLAAALLRTALAHDPYEITSVVYVYSNRIDLFVEMEFPTGMRLAGLEPDREVSPARQFETAQTALKDLAGNFFTFTAGNNAVLPLRTNLELGVEDHIRIQMEFAPTPYRPLQFTADGLQNIVDSASGTSLTVLDMVHQKVLGQTTLFADSQRAEFPPPTASSISVSAPALETNSTPQITVSATSPDPNPPPAIAAEDEAAPKLFSVRRAFMLVVVILGIAIFVLGIHAVKRKSDSKA